MGAGQSELQGSLNKLPSLQNNPTELKAELYNFVASVPLNTPLTINVNGKKLLDTMLKLLRDEYVAYNKSKQQLNADLLMCINAFTRLCKIKGFYTILYSVNITVLVDILKSSGNDILTLSILQCISYVLNCRVTVSESDKKKWVDTEQQQYEEKNKIAVFESGGYTQLLTVLQQQFTLIEQSKANNTASTANYDILCSVLDILSLDLVDHMNTSRYIIIQTILTGLKNHWDTLLSLTIHPVRSSQPIDMKLMCYASLLLQGLMIHSTIERCAALQNKILYDGYILYYILYSIDMQNVQPHVTATDPTKFAYMKYYSTHLTGLTRNLLSLITTNHSWNQELIFRSLPQPIWQATYNQISRPTPNNPNTQKSVDLDKRVSKDDKKQLESTLLYAYSTGKIQRIDWHHIFISLDKQHNSPVLIWTVYNKIELLQSLYNEIEAYEITKFVYSNNKTAVVKYNYAAYDIQYKSMYNYCRVNQYYISCLINALNNPKTKITQKMTSEIVPLLIQIFQQLCIELSVNWRVGLLRAVRAIHGRFGLLKGSFKHIQIIQYLVYCLNDCYRNIENIQKLQNDASMSQTTTDTVKLTEYIQLRDFAFDFLLTLLHDPIHIVTYLQQPNSVSILLQYINQVHTVDISTVLPDRHSFLIEFITSLSQVKIAENKVTLAKAGQKLTDIQHDNTGTVKSPVQTAVPITDVNAENGEEKDSTETLLSNDESTEDVIPYQTEKQNLCVDVPVARDVLSTSEYALAVLILLSRGGAKCKKQVSTNKVVNTLVKLQLIEYSELKQVSCQFLLELLDDSCHYVPTLYTTGIWLFVLYSWRYNILPQHIELIEKYHNKQYTQQSAMLYAFPQPMIQYLENNGVQKFIELVQSDSVADSTVIWSKDMYQTMLHSITEYVQPYIDLLRTKPNTVYKYNSENPLQVHYTQLEQNLCIHNVYIDTFNKNAATGIESIEIHDPVTFLTELSRYQQSQQCTTEQLYPVVQAQIYTVKKYSKELEQSTYQYNIAHCIELLRTHQTDSTPHGIQEKTVELIHCILPTQISYCTVIFDMKGLDTIIQYIQRTIQTIDTIHSTDERKHATSYIPLLYYLLHTLAYLCNKHSQSLKHIEYTPQLVQLLCTLLSDQYSLHYPNATMAVCKCMYVFVQHSEKLNVLLFEYGAVLQLCQLVLYYDAPQHLRNRQAVGEAKQQNSIDWTNKIKLGTTYVLNTILKSEYQKSITVLHKLFTVELCMLLHDKPSEFVKLINSNTPSVQTVKQQLQPYLTQQLQLVTETGRWQQYVDDNVIT